MHDQEHQILAEAIETKVVPLIEEVIEGYGLAGMGIGVVSEGEVVFRHATESALWVNRPDAVLPLMEVWRDLFPQSVDVYWAIGLGLPAERRCDSCQRELE